MADSAPSPYCSVCRQPAMFREGVGVVHATVLGPTEVWQPVYPAQDTSGHQPDLKDWSAEYDRYWEQVSRHG